MSRVPPAASDGEEPPPLAARHEASFCNSPTAGAEFGDLLPVAFGESCSDAPARETPGEEAESQPEVAAEGTPVGEINLLSTEPSLAEQEYIDTLPVAEEGVPTVLHPFVAGKGGSAGSLAASAAEEGACVAEPDVAGWMATGQDKSTSEALGGAPAASEAPADFSTNLAHAPFDGTAPLLVDLDRDVLYASEGPSPLESQGHLGAPVLAAPTQSAPQLRSPPAASAPNSLLASTAFAPPPRNYTVAAAGSYPRAEAFLGRPIEFFEAPPDTRLTDQARWLFNRRRPEAALRALPVGEADVEAALLRIRCLALLRRHQSANEELAQLTAKHGEGLPFQARIIAALMPLMYTTANPFQSMGLLRDLAAKVLVVDKVATLSEHLQLLRHLSHVALVSGHGEVAAESIRSAAQFAASAGRATDAAEFHALLGRHCVEAGDAVGAAAAFALAKAQGRRTGSASALLDDGLLLVAQGKCAAARAPLEAAAVAALASVDAAVSRGEEVTPWSPSVDEAVAAANNLAVCRLSAQQLREAVADLEALVRRDPALYLRQSVAQNLSSLYEFLPEAKQRRLTLRELVDGFQLGDIEPRSIEQLGA